MYIRCSYSPSGFLFACILFLDHLQHECFQCTWGQNILDLLVQILAFSTQFNSFFLHTYIFLFNSNKHVLFLVCSLRVQSLCSAFQNYCCFAISGADPGFFLGGGTLVSCPTSTPINHIYIFFWQNTSCIRKPQVISGGGGRCAPPAPFP